MNEAIKNRFTGAIIVEAGKYASIKEAVEKNRADLSGADLSRTNLSGAYLSGAYGEKLTLPKDNPVLCIGPIGSRQAHMTAYNTDKGIYIKTGCYFDTIEKFKEAVHEKHKNTKYSHDYMTAIAFVKAVMRK
jgi:hypothetical protein